MRPSKYLAKPGWYTADFKTQVPKGHPEAKHYCDSAADAKLGADLVRLNGMENVKYQPKAFEFSELYHKKYNKYLKAHTSYQPDFLVDNIYFEVKNGKYDYPGALRKIALFLDLYPHNSLYIVVNGRFYDAKKYLDFARKRDKDNREKKKKLAALRKMAIEQATRLLLSKAEYLKRKRRNTQ